MSQPVMVSPIIISLSGLRNGTVFLTIVAVDVNRPIATQTAGEKNSAVILISAHRGK